MRRNALKGLRKYEAAQRPNAIAHGIVRSRTGAAQLLQLDAQQKRGGAAVVLIPSLVNSHHILDLTEKTSLARYLAAQGHDPWLVDWGYPVAEDRELDIAGHIEHRLLPLVRSIDRPLILVGYCLGGTMTIAAAQIAKPRAVATIAAPWHFDRYPPEDIDRISGLWRDAKPLCERLGFVPMEVLQSGFWALDPTRTVRKYAAFADLEDGSEGQRAFLAVEDWANDGAPLTFAAAEDLFERLYAANMTGAGQWRVGGQAIDPAKLECPNFSILSATDKIVPAASSPGLTQSFESSLGHVGMIVSAKAPKQIWTRLSQWLSDNGG